MRTPQAEQLGQAMIALRPRQMGAIPLVYPILTDLRVRQATNELVPSQADIDVGRVAVLLTFNRLLAPQPLYHVGDWLGETVLPQVLGIAPEKVYDNRLGRALDRLYPHLGELWARLVSRAVQVYDLDLNVLHPMPVLGFGNCAPFKTSDQSNAMKWLAYLFVYERDGLLHIGRAIPRAWFGQEQAFSATRLSTAAGIVSVEYRPHLAAGKIEADVELELRGKPEQVLLRFRHPEKKPIRAVEVNGRPHRSFDAKRGDVELPPVSGRARVSVSYEDGR